jgi:hypothetical protein
MHFVLSRKLLLIFIVIGVVGAGIAYLPHGSPTTDNVKPDYSEHRTIKEMDDKVFVNFKQCTADRRTIFVSFGSTVIVIRGAEKNGSCSLKYGGEVENPKWNGDLPFDCTVPISLGSIAFPKTQYGVDFSSIQQYCTK